MGHVARVEFSLRLQYISTLLGKLDILVVLCSARKAAKRNNYSVLRLWNILSLPRINRHITDLPNVMYIGYHHTHWY